MSECIVTLVNMFIKKTTTKIKKMEQMEKNSSTLRFSMWTCFEWKRRGIAGVLTKIGRTSINQIGLCLELLPYIE